MLRYLCTGTQKCNKDYDCGVNMECLANICYCVTGFEPENDYCIGKCENKINFIVVACLIVKLSKSFFSIFLDPKFKKQNKLSSKHQ